MNGILYPSNSKIYEKEPRYNKPFYLTNTFGQSSATSLNRGSTVNWILTNLLKIEISHASPS